MESFYASFKLYLYCTLEHLLDMTQVAISLLIAIVTWQSLENFIHDKKHLQVHDMKIQKPFLYLRCKAGLFRNGVRKIRTELSENT